jgi:hypothetical protein
MTLEHPNKHGDQSRPVDVEADEKRWQALELRKQAKSYREIARAMGCSLTAAYRYVGDALDELKAKVSESAEQLRTIEIEKLDQLEAKMKESLDKEDDPVARGKVAAVIVKITESRRKLLGLDAPQRIEHSGNLYTVKEASPDCEAWGQPAAKVEQKEGADDGRSNENGS